MQWTSHVDYSTIREQRVVLESGCRSSTWSAVRDYARYTYNEAMETERLQKLLARAGYGSRRTCESIIEEGRVTVDGQIARLGDKADPTQHRIEVDGVPISRPQPMLYIVLNKPRGVISTTSDPRGRRTVLDLIDIPLSRRGEPVRLYPVGRLDAESEGLILLTNDGALTQRLTHPSYEHPRVYRVLVEGVPDAATVERWQRGITLDGRPARFDHAYVEDRRHEDAWLRITVHEGRKHLVRRIVAALGHPPKRLIRIKMGPLELRELAVGKWRHLSDEERRKLREDVRGASSTRRGRPGSRRSSRRRPSRGRPSSSKPDRNRR